LTRVTRFRHPVRLAIALLCVVWLAVVVVQSPGGPEAAPASDEPSAERVKQVRALLEAVDQSELCYFERHERFSDNPAELTKSARDRADDVTRPLNPLVEASAHDFELDLYVSDDGQAYTQRILGDEIHSVFERDEDNEFADYGEFAYGNVADACLQ
jgi:hypothetical protein